MADRSISFPITLSDLERRDARGQICQAGLINNARTVWARTSKFGRRTQVWRGIFLRRTTKLGVVTHEGTACFYAVSHALHPKAVWPNGCQSCGFSSAYAYTVRPRTTKFGVVTHMRRIFFLVQPRVTRFVSDSRFSSVLWCWSSFSRLCHSLVWCFHCLHGRKNTMFKRWKICPPSVPHGW